MKTIKLFFVAMLLFAGFNAVKAQTVEVKPDYFDAYVDQAGKVEPALDMLLISNIAPPAVNLNSIVMNFKMPAIPAGMSLVGAAFTATVLRKDQWVSFNGDLYGIDFRATDVALASDYFSGAFVAGPNVGNGSDWGIMDNFLDNAAITFGNPITSTQTTNEGANTQLVNFLKQQYGNGAVNKYAFLRLSMDNVTPTTNWQRYAVAPGDNATYYPRLTFIFGLPDAISKVDQSNGITIYADRTGRVNAKVDAALENATLAVYSVTGAKISSEILTSSNFISTKKLNPGAYIVKLSNSGKETSRSVLVK
ncbi:MAG: T9SS type A sorting domain-containing protein [Bacteroidales bacterium]|nr:T9SS type A sorting domain-containing protein [Bacteroidales bacterium]